MQKIKILNFQNLNFLHAEASNKPFSETSFAEIDTLNVVVIRNPYAYFDDYLAHCIYNEMSLKLKNETLKAMKTLDKHSFLTWFETLNYLPLINPQTFQLDVRKRLHIAIENLESFDYVVPYEEMESFIENIAPDMKITKREKKPLSFSLFNAKESPLIQSIIEKDTILYERALQLWEQTKENDFKPLLLPNDKKVMIEKSTPSINRYLGVVGILTTTSIAGWVINLDSEESVLIAIYKNGILIEQTLADGMRPDLQKLKKHPTGLCGFKLIFDTPTFKMKDIVEVKTIPDNVIIGLSPKAKSFLEKD